MIPPHDLNRPQNISEEGWSAFYANQGEGACPYSDDTSRAAWLAGHRAASDWFDKE